MALEDRYKVYLEYFGLGAVQGIQQDLDRIKQAAAAGQATGTATGQMNQALTDAHGTVQKTTAAVEQHVATVAKVPHATKEAASSLDVFSKATYELGMGAYYANVPMLGMVSTVGNVQNGFAMMASGLRTMIGELPLWVTGLTAGAIAIAAVGGGLVAAASAAGEMIRQIRLLQDLAPAGGLAGAYQGAAFGNLTGNQGAAAGILTRQAGESATYFAQQMALGGRVGQGPLPGLSIPAQYGVSGYQPGSTVLNRINKPTGQLMLDIAKAVEAQPAERRGTALIQLARYYGLSPEDLNGVSAILRQNQGRTDAQILATVNQLYGGFEPSGGQVGQQTQVELLQRQLGARFGRFVGAIGAGTLGLQASLLHGGINALSGTNAAGFGVGSGLGIAGGPIGMVAGGLLGASGDVGLPHIQGPDVGGGLAALFEDLRRRRGGGGGPPGGGGPFGGLFGGGGGGGGPLGSGNPPPGLQLLSSSFNELDIRFQAIINHLPQVNRQFDIFSNITNVLRPVFQPMISGFEGLLRSLADVNFDGWNTTITRWGASIVTALGTARASLDPMNVSLAVFKSFNDKTVNAIVVAAGGVDLAALTAKYTTFASQVNQTKTATVTPVGLADLTNLVTNFAAFASKGDASHVAQVLARMDPSSTLSWDQLQSTLTPKAIDDTVNITGMIKSAGNQTGPDPAFNLLTGANLPIDQQVWISTLLKDQTIGGQTSTDWWTKIGLDVTKYISLYSKGAENVQSQVDNLLATQTKIINIDNVTSHLPGDWWTLTAAVTKQVDVNLTGVPTFLTGATLNIDNIALPTSTETQRQINDWYSLAPVYIPVGLSLPTSSSVDSMFKNTYHPAVSAGIQAPSPQSLYGSLPSWMQNLLGLSGLSGVPIWTPPPAALGGLFTRPTVALLGEAGPEYVIPANRMPGASPLGGIGPGFGGGGSAVTINNYIQVDAMDFSDPQSVQRVAAVVSNKIAQNINTLTGTGRILPGFARNLPGIG